MSIFETFLYLYENKLHFLKVRPFFIKDAKNHRNRLNHCCQKTRFKNITNLQINGFGPPWLDPTFQRKSRLVKNFADNSISKSVY